MSTVFRVFDRVRQHDIALKRLGHPGRELPGEGARRWFEREYHTLSQLAHPRIVEVYDYGVDELGPFYTMELLEGECARDCAVLDFWKLSLVLRDVASALSLLHSRRYVHRDVTPRNIFILPDGRAKLIDFGAMTPMGVAKQLVGTPQMTAPEMINAQALDGRTDLYALGATAYRLLTGRHAYPSPTFGLLRDHWRTPPPHPRGFVPDAPEGLCALIMGLLSLDPAGRPSSATEVIERLGGIARLPPDPELLASAAYLRTPRLVGRADLLLSVRKHVVGAFAGQGHALWVHGEAGAGRSRFVDACVMEAKLIGMTVLRADDGDATEDYGVVRALARQLIDSYPNAAQRAAVRCHPALFELLPGLAPDGAAPGAKRATRPALQLALRQWLTAVARRRALMLAIDNIDRIDEPSAASIATLSEMSRQYKLMVVVSAESGREANAPAAVDFLAHGATQLCLENLELAHTRELLASVFGEVPNLDLLVDRLFAISRGNPRALMELCQRLLDQGVVHYAAGRFVLPRRLRDGDLPRSTGDAIEARIGELSADALALGQVWSLSPESRFALEELAQLAELGDAARLYRAVDALIVARAAHEERGRFWMAHAGFIAALSRSIPHGEASRLHARVAHVLGRRGDDDGTLSAADHLMAAGEVASALQHLAAFAERRAEAVSRDRPVESLTARASARHGTILERGLALAREHGGGPRLEHLLRTALVRHHHGGDPAAVRRFVGPLLKRLELDAGLDDFARLAGVPDGAQRLSQALAATQARYDACPEADRVFAPLEAVQLLARVCLDVTSTAPVGFDYALLESCPSLEPLGDLSPALSVAQRIVDATRALIGGRYFRSLELYRSALARLRGPDRAGLDALTHRRSVLGVTYGLGMLEALLGMSSALQRADELDAEPSHQVNAWMVRRMVHLAQGDGVQAEQCRKRAELLRIQNAPEQWYEGTSVQAEVLNYANADNLLGLRAALPDMRAMAERYPDWQPLLRFCEGEHARIGDDPNGALEHYQAVLDTTQPGRSGAWPRAVGQYIATLVALGREGEAVERGRVWLATAVEHDVYGSTIAPALALAEALTGEHEVACQRADACIDELVRHTISGMPLGIAHEARARIAIAMGDRAGYLRHAAACAEHFRAGRDSALTARHERLALAARQSGLVGGAERACVSTMETDTGEMTDMLHTLFRKCDGPAERARSVLSLLLEQCRADEGYLLLQTEGGLSLAASRGEPPEGLLDYARECIEHEIQQNAEGAELGDLDGDTGSDVSGLCTARGVYRPYLLTTGLRRGIQLAGVLMLRMPDDDSIPEVRYDLLRDAAHALLDAGDLEVIAL